MGDIKEQSVRQFRFKLERNSLSKGRVEIMKVENDLYNKIKYNLKSVYRGSPDICIDYYRGLVDLISLFNSYDYNLSFGWYVDSLVLSYIHDVCAINGSPDYSGYDKELKLNNHSVDILFKLIKDYSVELKIERFSKKKHLCVVKWFIHYLTKISNNSILAIKYPRDEKFRKEFNVSNKDFSYSIILRLIDMLKREGLVLDFTGNILYGSRPMSMLVVNPELLNILELEIKTTEKYNELPKKSLIKITDSKGKEIPPEMCTDREYYDLMYKDTSRILNKYHSVVNSATPALNGYTLNGVYIHRVIKENKFISSRFFDDGSFQGKPKSVRSLLELHGESTVSLDFKAIHPSILMYYEGISLEDHNPYPTLNNISVNVSDVVGFKRYYGLDKYDPVRNIVKKLFLCLINADSINKAVGSCYEDLHKDYLKKGTYQEHTMKYVGLPNINLHEVALSILEHNKAISKYLGVGKGNELQYIDSQIIARCLDKLSDLKIPCIPVHDAISCKVSDKHIVKEVMKEAFVFVVGEGSLKNCIIEEE